MLKITHQSFRGCARRRKKSFVAVVVLMMVVTAVFAMMYFGTSPHGGELQVPETDLYIKPYKNLLITDLQHGQYARERAQQLLPRGSGRHTMDKAELETKVEELRESAAVDKKMHQEILDKQFAVLQAKLELLEPQEAERSRQIAQLNAQLTTLSDDDDYDDRITAAAPAIHVSHGAESKCVAPWDKDGVLLTKNPAEKNDREVRLHIMRFFLALISDAKQAKRQLHGNPARVHSQKQALQVEKEPDMEPPSWYCYDTVIECDSASRRIAATSSPFPFMIRANTYANDLTMVTFGMCGNPDTRVSLDIFDKFTIHGGGKMFPNRRSRSTNVGTKRSGQSFLLLLKTQIQGFAMHMHGVPKDTTSVYESTDDDDDTFTITDKTSQVGLAMLAIIEPYMASSVKHTNCSLGINATSTSIGSAFVTAGMLPDTGDEPTMQPAVQGAPSLIIMLIWDNFVQDGQAARTNSMQRATAVSELEIQPICVSKNPSIGLESIIARIWPQPDEDARKKGTTAPARTINLITNFITVGGESPHAKRILDAVAAEAARRGTPFVRPGEIAASLEISKAALQPFLREHGLAELSLAEYDKTHPPTRFPVFVKPFKGGGSHGVSIAHNRAEYDRAIKGGGGWTKMLAQEALEGQDVWTVYLTVWKGELVRRECRLYRFDAGMVPINRGGDTSVKGMHTLWIPCPKSLSLEHSKRIARASGCHGFCCVNMKERAGRAPGIFDFNARIGGGLFESAERPSASGWPDVPITASDDAAAVLRGVRCSSENVLDGRSGLLIHSNPTNYTMRPPRMCAPPPLISHFRSLLAKSKLEAAG